MNRRAILTQSELTRYLKAYRDAGIPVARCEINREGKVVIHSIAAGTGVPPDAPNPWDEA